MPQKVVMASDPQFTEDERKLLAARILKRVQLVPCSTQFSGLLESPRCWEWQGTTAGGYPVLERLGKSLNVRRLCYILFNKGKPLGEMSLRSHCKNQRCVNPQHMYIVNMRKGGRKAVTKAVSRRTNDDS